MWHGRKVCHRNVIADPCGQRKKNNSEKPRIMFDAA
jgi:hypothetical protein